MSSGPPKFQPFKPSKEKAGLRVVLRLEPSVDTATDISRDDLKKIAPEWQRGPVTVFEDNTVICGLRALQSKLE